MITTDDKRITRNSNRMEIHTNLKNNSLELMSKQERRITC